MSLNSLFHLCGIVQSDIDLPFEGKLVYVEDVSQDGLTAGRFGDLVLLDGYQNKRVLLTKDNYYNMNPSWFNDGVSILFESKRDPDLFALGLSWGSSLFEIDINTREIKSFRRDLLEHELVENRMYAPSLSHSSNKLLFRAQQASPIRIHGEDRIIMLNIEQDTLIHLISDRPYLGAFWSPNDSLIIHNTFQGNHTRIRVREAISGSVIRTLNLQDELVVVDMMGKKVPVNCMPGEWVSNDEFLYSCYNNRIPMGYIFKHSLASNETTLLAEIDEWFIQDLAKVSEDEVVFIGTSEHRDRPYADFLLVSEIFLFNFEDQKLTQITHNQRQKTNLRVFRK
jgi:hypothetical protein